MKKIFWTLVVVISMFSCRDQEQVDVKTPVIESVEMDGIAASTVVKQAGETLVLDVHLTDNTALNQLQIDLHPADDGHVHDADGHAGGEGRLTNGYWAMNEIINISGTSFHQQWQLQIPDSIAGNWHILLSVMDEIGLVSKTYCLLVTVENANLPTISANTFPAYDATGTIYLSNGVPLEIDGLAEDPDGLSKLWVRMSNYAGVSADTLDIPIIGDGHTMAFGTASFNTTGNGNYRIIVEAQDSLGYKAIWDAKVIVQ
ncbi:MAG: DUF4625 domain-containing protein [Flavobacteriales bacterium]|nr:DUF4625 domain-containing protein [Flavobacteriales bacterium]